MGKIKSKNSKLTINKSPEENQGCCSEQYPWFSFKSLTANARYNLSKLPAGHEKVQVLDGLLAKLNELSNEPWVYWTQQPKNAGLETLTYDKLKFKANKGSVLTGDTTIYVFRFDTHLGVKKGRIIGYKESPCSVFHIIGYDLDFSAYDHGD